MFRNIFNIHIIALRFGEAISVLTVLNDLFKNHIELVFDMELYNDFFFL